MNKKEAISHDSLRQIAGKDTVTSPDELANYAVDGISPQAVVLPKTVEQVSSLLQLAWQDNQAVAPWGGGTRIELGNAPARLDTVVCLNRLDRVLDYPTGDLILTVEAGITLAKLRQVLAGEGQSLPIDPPLPSEATIGGTLASSADGPLKWRYNGPRDLVIGMKVVQANGKVTKSGGQVVKNVTGYDMARLHIGALGTLGIIVEASFKLIPLPKKEETVLSTFQHLDDSYNAAMSILQSPITPMALTIMSPDALAYFQDAPLPKSGSYILAVHLAGGASAVVRQVNEVRQLASASGVNSVESLESNDARNLWRGIGDLGYRKDLPTAMSTKANLPPSQTRELLSFLESLTIKGIPRAALLCHVGSGVVHSHWFGNPADLDLDGLLEAARSARAKARKLNGFLTIERYPTAMKERIDVWDDPGSSLEIMRRMKEQYDHKGILNPGRYVGGI